jgi:hypothetical protein
MDPTFNVVDVIVIASAIALAGILHTLATRRSGDPPEPEYSPSEDERRIRHIDLVLRFIAIEWNGASWRWPK